MFLHTCLYFFGSQNSDNAIAIGTDAGYSNANRKIIPAALKAGSKQSLSSSEKLNKIKQLEEKLKRMEKKFYKIR